MRILFYIISFLSILLAIFYTFFVTKYSSDILKPIIEQKIKHRFNIDTDITKLDIYGLNRFSVVMNIEQNNTLVVTGEFNLLLREFDIDYIFKINNANSISYLKKFHIQKPFKIKAKSIGNIEKFRVDAYLDVYNSDTYIHSNIDNFNYKTLNKQDINFTLDSNISDGDLKVVFKNGFLSGSFNLLEVLDILKIIDYPKFAKGRVSGDFKYSLLSKDGKVDAVLKDTYFVKNRVFDAVKLFGFTNLYKESFNGKLDGTIKNSVVFSKFNLKSKSAMLDSNDTKLYIDSNRLESNMIVYIQNDPITTKLNGNINSLNVSINMEEFLNSKLAKEIKNRAINFLDSIFKIK